MRRHRPTPPGQRRPDQDQPSPRVPSGCARPGRSRSPASAALLMLVCASAQAQPASNLPWISGAKDGLPCLPQLRHNPLDIAHVHIEPRNFQLLVAATSAGCVTGAGPVCAKDAVLAAPWSLLSLALLPTDNKGQFAQCARGDFDAHWRQIGANIASYSAGHTVIVEPGWEANLGSTLHPWGVEDISQAEGFKNCWSHAVRGVKLMFPAAKIAWTNAKRFLENSSVDDINPGTVPGTDALI